MGQRSEVRDKTKPQLLPGSSPNPAINVPSFHNQSFALYMQASLQYVSMNIYLNSRFDCVWELCYKWLKHSHVPEKQP